MPIVKLIDFGVARSTDSDVTVTTMHTHAGALIGTLAYMSPEQCEGDALNVDTRSDVYSLGVVLYELVCGRRPYDLPSTSMIASIRAVQDSEPTPPRTLRPKLPRDLDRVLLKALEKKPDARYASVADLAADLRRHLAGEPVSIRPKTMMTRIARWAVKHPRTMTLVSCLVIAGLVAASSSLFLYLYSFRPDRVEVAEGNRSAVLRAFDGRVLWEWPENPTPGVKAVSEAVLIPRPEELGGGRLAIIAYQYEAPGDLRNTLVAYTVKPGRWMLGTRVEEAWRVRISDDDVPPEMLAKGRSGATCMVNLLYVADIFDDPDLPGDEIVASWALAPFSQTALVIYDLAGNPLYRVWQDGGIQSIYWMSGPELLVCVGDDEEVKDVMLEEMPGDQPIGKVVFAMRPQRGLMTREFLETASDERFRPVWYRYIHPLKTDECEFRVQVGWPLFRQHDAARYAQINAFFGDYETKLSKLRSSMNLIIDENGREVPNSRVEGDHYRGLIKAKTPGIPQPEEFQLRDDPPVPDHEKADWPTRSLPPRK